MTRFRIFLFTFLLFSGTNAFAQGKFQFGLSASPLINWLKAENSRISSGKARMGFDYGLMADINFTKNYILATGITATLTGGNQVFEDSLLYFLNNNDARFTGNTDARLKLQYLNIPLIFKLRTNEIGKFRYYGGIGLVSSFRFKARIDAENNSIKIFDNVNFVKRKDQTGGVFRSNVFNLSLQVEGGFEFPFSENTALLVGLFYRNGFVNLLDDNDEDKTFLNCVGLKAGILF